MNHCAKNMNQTLVSVAGVELLTSVQRDHVRFGSGSAGLLLRCRRRAGCRPEKVRSVRLNQLV